MIKILRSRIQQGYRTKYFPADQKEMPERFLGRPLIRPGKCTAGCSACAQVCPTCAITVGATGVSLDMGKCIFCGSCTGASSCNCIEFSKEYRLSAGSKKKLIVSGAEADLLEQSPKKGSSIFKRSFKLRQVSAGGCNACELDINVLNTLSFDLGRFGISFTASPRHADALVVTGPVTLNMRAALEKTYEALPAPKLVVAVGACAVSGGLFAGHKEACGGVDKVIPVDCYIPGCPPHPLTILDGLIKVKNGSLNK